jgi:hypothetical protein
MNSGGKKRCSLQSYRFPIRLCGKAAFTGNTYNSQIRREALKEFEVEIVNQSVTIDGNIITICNPASAIDVAFLLLEKLSNKDNAAFIKQAMGFTNNQS